MVKPQPPCDGFVCVYCEYQLQNCPELFSTTVQAFSVRLCTCEFAAGGAGETDTPHAAVFAQ